MDPATVIAFGVNPTMLPERIYPQELVLDEGIVEIGAPIAADTGTVLVASQTRSARISDLPGALEEAGWRGKSISVK